MKSMRNEELKIRCYQDFRAYNMAKRTVTWEKPISWLETISCIFDSFAVRCTIDAQ
jgi:hypothetical protein